MSSPAPAALAVLWATAGCEAEALRQDTFTGEDPVLRTQFRIGAVASATIAASSLAAIEVHRARGAPRQSLRVAANAAVALFRSERYCRVNGAPPEDPWSPIAGFYPTADGKHVQLHTNFPHHRVGTLALLGCTNDRSAVTSAIASWRGADLEDALAERGMCGALVRTAHEWEAHPQAVALADLPTIEVLRIGDAPATPLPPLAARPLTGIRVLDLTRVIAGPVAGRELAAHGADVLQVSAQHLPSLPALNVDVNRGKRSTFIDLRTAFGQNTLARLASRADVFIQGYRPGALDALGFSPEALTAARPGIVYVSLSAYGHAGPWAQRRGFDTLVQAVSGIAHDHGSAVGVDGPAHLPVSAIDHATGYLAAFGAQVALLRRVTEGGSWLVRVSLAQTGHFISGLGLLPTGSSATDQGLSDVTHLLAKEHGASGEVTYVRHAAQLSSTPPYWEHAAPPLGSQEPLWLY